MHQGTVQVNSAGSMTSLAEVDLGDTYNQTATLALSNGSVVVGYTNQNNNWGQCVQVGLNGGTGALTLAGNSSFDGSAAAQGGFGSIVIGAGSDGAGHPSLGSVTVGGNSTLAAGDGTGSNNAQLAIGPRAASAA